MDLGYDVVVTISGMVLVFLILILLMLIIMLEGKAFQSLSDRKRPAAPAAPKPAAPAPGPAVQKAEAPAAQPAPEVEQGIPGDVIAAIAAAICAMGNGKYTLRAVRRADRGGWSKAGVSDTTSPF